jgi:hypothetical protein
MAAPSLEFLPPCERRWKLLQNLDAGLQGLKPLPFHKLYVEAEAATHKDQTFLRNG